MDDEKVFDLLSCRVVPSPSGPDGEMLYGRDYTAALDLLEIECNTIDDVMRCLEKGLHLHGERSSFDRGMAVAFLDHHSIFQVRYKLSSILFCLFYVSQPILTIYFSWM